MKRIKLNIQLFADGKVVIETDLDRKGFESGINKMQSIAKTGFKAIATSVGVASTAIAGLIGKAVTMAGDLEQQIGGTEAVFGEFADTVQKKAAGAFDQMGLSANDFMATANKMGALMQGSGLSIEESMDLSTQAMQRAADVASIMGIDVTSAMESVAGAAKGNFTMMDNLGVAMNATTIEAYALSKGIDESFASMDNATKVGLAMEMFLEKTSYAAGNYAKENKTFAGSFNTLKAATSNFLSGAGGIEDVADALIGFSDILIESIGNMAPNIVEGLVQLTQTLMPQIPVLIESLLPTILDGAVGIINGLVIIFPEIIRLVGENLPLILQAGMNILLALINGVTQSLPELTPIMTTVLMNMVNILLDNIDIIIEAGITLLIALTSGIMNALPELITRIPEIVVKIIAALFNLLPEILAAGIRLIIELGLGLIRGIPQLIIRIPEIIARMVSALLEGVKDFANVGVNLVKGIWNGISNSFTWIKNKITGWVGNVMDFIKGLFGIHSPSTVMRDEVGKYLAQGLGVGFDNELDNVYNDMQHAIDLETGKMTANVQASGTYQMAMAGTPTFNLVDNANNTTQLVVNGKVLAEVVNTENRNREVATA